MGLAGRKTKQRIGEDPRNLTWSDDSSKFGAKYLQSLGWTSGTGLGISGEGRTSNLKIHQKLDLMGIGANRRAQGGDDVGWRGAREFDGLLARLNQAQNADTQDIPVVDDDAKSTNDSDVDQSTRGTESVVADEPIEVPGHALDTSIIGKKRKRDTEQKKTKGQKMGTIDGEPDPKEAKRRRKEEKKEQRKAEKAAKKTMKSLDAYHEDHVTLTGNGDKQGQNTEVVKMMPRVRAHRARNLASKRLAAGSATGMNEILGIAPSAAVGQAMQASSNLPLQDHPIAGEPRTRGFGPITVNNRFRQTAETNNIEPRSSMGLGFRNSKQKTTDAVQGDNGNDILRSSGKSVAEYFAEKMRMKSTTQKGAVIDQDAENRKA